MAEIARAADVSTQTVFNYFPTKEDLVYWRLESFEDELLRTIREREPGESALAAFGRFVRAPRGMLGDYDAEAREALAALTRMIVSSPALLAREQQIFARYTGRALAEEPAASDIEARVAANAMMGVHRALVRLRPRADRRGRAPPRTRATRCARRPTRRSACSTRGLGGYAERD